MIRIGKSMVKHVTKKRRKMKKIIGAIAVAVSVCSAMADGFAWSWWCDNKSDEVDVSLGIGSQCRKVDALELSLVYGASSEVDGVQWSFMGINNSNMTGALQLAPWFNSAKEPCVQLGMLNISKESVFTWGFINVADESKVQLGLLNFNKNGFLPIFPFINLDKSFFN
jgi:hypothetical protein